jgi:hypothetical protein
VRPSPDLGLHAAPAQRSGDLRGLIDAEHRPGRLRRRPPRGHDGAQRHRATGVGLL